MSRFTKVLLLSAVMLALSFSSAFGAIDDTAPYWNWWHTTNAQIVDGKTDYNPVDEGTNKPHFWFMHAYVHNIPEKNWQGSVISIDAAHSAHVSYSYDDGQASEIFVGPKELHLYPGGDNIMYVGDANGGEAGFGLSDGYDGVINEETQTAFSGQPFTVSAGDTSFTGTFPAFDTTETHINNKCIPFLELVTDGTGSTLLGIKWRFVDASDPETALIRKGDDDERSNLSRLFQFEIRLVNDSGRTTVNVPVSYLPKVGEALEGETTLDASLPMDQLQFIRTDFNYTNGTNGTNAQITYRWTFYVSGTVPPLHSGPVDQPSPAMPTVAEVADATDAAAAHLATAPTEVIAVEEINITTGSLVTFSDSGIKSRTSSVIAISQPVEEGGAAVLSGAGGLPLPLNNQSLEGLDLPQPSDFVELVRNYSVVKYFDGGGSINLLSSFGDRIFTYSVDTGVTLTATVIVIDDAAPARVADDNIIRPYANANFGVMLSNDDKFLFIWDGTKNGVAKDPIALVKEEKGGSGSSGCNAGFGALALIALGAIVPTLRRR